MQRRSHRKAATASLILTTLLIAAGLGACGKTDTSASLMADAKQYQQKGDNKAAMIQLKNAASKSPDDAEVRLQLAALHIQMADPVSAEKEIRKAIALGIDSARAAPHLTRALLMQGQAKKALAESEKLADGDALVLAARGDAYLKLLDPDKAKESYRRAIAIQPGLPEGLIGLARVAIGQKDVAAATQLVEQAISANPNNAAVWFFKGGLLRAQGKTQESVAALGRAISLNGNLVDARLERASLEIADKQFAAAKADIDAARNASPNSLSPIYAQAQLDFTQGNFAAAKESLQKILKVAPEHQTSILLAGATELGLGNITQSEQHLKKYLESDPNNAVARKLLAQAMLKGAKPADAVAVLAPLMTEEAQDAQLLALAGESSLRTRDFSKATQYLEKASTLAPKSASLHTSLGLAKLGQGNEDVGLLELEKATALDPKSEAAAIALIRSELSLKHYDKALAAVKTLVARRPQDALVRNLEGGVYMTNGDRTAARASFQQAASLQPDLFAPVSNLAQLDVQDKKTDQAKRRVLAFLDKNKKSSEAKTMMAKLATLDNNPGEATAWLEKASADKPEDVALALQLAQQYMRTDQVVKALSLVRKLQTNNPANPEVLDALGQLQLASDDDAGALNTYGTLVKVLPKSAAPHLRLAGVHVKMKNQAAAAEDLKRALQLDPDFMPAKLAQIKLAGATGKTDQALSLARSVQKSDPKAYAGYVLEGDLLARQNKADLALRAYEQAYAINKTPQMLIKLATLMKASGKTGEADARLAQWQKEHPQDPTVGMYLGGTYLKNKQYKAAIDQYEAVLKLSPDDPIALNNLASAYRSQKDPRALATAERAVKLVPENAAVMDTLGWILVQQGQLARGLPILQKAVGLSPSSPELRYHLAFALNQSGDKKAARQELEQLIASAPAFAQIEEAKALLKTL